MARRHVMVVLDCQGMRAALHTGGGTSGHVQLFSLLPIDQSKYISSDHTSRPEMRPDAYNLRYVWTVLLESRINGIALHLIIFSYHLYSIYQIWQRRSVILLHKIANYAQIIFMYIFIKGLRI